MIAHELFSTGSPNMSQIDDIKNNAVEIANGLRKLGPDRVVALSVHVSKDLIADLEQRAKQLIEQLDSLEG
jgi:hypothetical protein